VISLSAFSLRFTPTRTRKTQVFVFFGGAMIFAQQQETWIEDNFGSSQGMCNELSASKKCCVGRLHKQFRSLPCVLLISGTFRHAAESALQRMTVWSHFVCEGHLVAHPVSNASLLRNRFSEASTSEIGVFVGERALQKRARVGASNTVERFLCLTELTVNG